MSDSGVQEGGRTKSVQFQNKTKQNRAKVSWVQSRRRNQWALDFMLWSDYMEFINYKQDPDTCRWIKRKTNVVKLKHCTLIWCKYDDLISSKSWLHDFEKMFNWDLMLKSTTSTGGPIRKFNVMTIVVKIIVIHNIITIIKKNSIQFK